MRLSDFISPELVIAGLPATSISGAANALLDRLVAAGVVDDADKLRRRVEEARPEDIVAMGDRAFLLHYRTDALHDLRIALGTAREPICREVGDGDRQCARILILVAAHPRMAARYLQVVGALARMLSREAVVEQLLEQATPDALASLALFSEHELPAQITVREIMTERPRTASPDTPLRSAAREMVRHGIGGLPVVDDGNRVIGMIGEKELIRTLLSSYLQGGRGGRPPGPQPDAPTVRDAMTRQVLCVSPEQPLAEVSAIMTHKDVDRVPVVREGRLVGLLTRGDIVRKLIGY